jgi:hypothetical protein
MADEVPFHALAHQLDLPLCLLDVVLSDDLDPGPDGLPNPFIAYGLGDGHEAHPGRVTACARGGRRNPLPDPADVLAHFEHGSLLFEIHQAQPLQRLDDFAKRKPYDKAGGYAVQGKASFLISGIRGSYTNVVGLPLCEVVKELKKLGLVDFKGE